MLFLLVTLLVAGALSAPTPQLLDINTQDGNTRLVPLFIQDSVVSPTTLIPVVVPAPTIEEAVQVVEEEGSRVASDLSDVAQLLQTEENVEETIKEEISEAAAVVDTIDAAVEDVQSSSAPEAVVQAELAEADVAKATVEETVASDIQLTTEAEKAALAKISDSVVDIATTEDRELTINKEIDLSDGGLQSPLPNVTSNVMAMVIEAAVEEAEERSVPSPEAQEDSVVEEQVSETPAVELELVDSIVASETDVQEPELVQDGNFAESGAEESVQSENVDASENSAVQTEAAGEAVAVENEPSEIQETVLIETSEIGNAEKDGSTVTQVVDIVEEGPVEEVLSITPEEEQEISTVGDTIAEAEAVIAQAEEILSDVVDPTLNKKVSESVQNEADPESRGKSLSSAPEVGAAESESETVAEVTTAEETETIDAATRSAIEAALDDQAPDTEAIVIFPQVTEVAETQTDASLLHEDPIFQTEIAVPAETDAPELDIASETVASIPVEATTSVIIVHDEAISAPAASEVVQISESSASQISEVASSQPAVEINQKLPKQRPTPAQGNLLVNPATKSAFFSTSSFGSPVSAANIILGQPVRVPGTFGFSSGLTPQLQGSSNLQARNSVDPRFRQFIFDNDSPDVIAAKINFFRFRAATLGAPIAISVGPSPGSSSTEAPAATSSSPELAPSSTPETATEPKSSSLQESAPSITIEAVESSSAAPSETA
ncbi:hypothetical protein FHG87_007325 [Trinorchestia longiramus]|nr:hypothetical protein FHG87_007325 [Trinorchestia longiramus]